MGDKSVKTLGSKIRFSSIKWKHSPHPPPQTMLIFFYFLDSTDHNTYTTLNWRARGIRKLMLDANKIEQGTRHSASILKSIIFLKCINCFCRPLSGVYLCCISVIIICRPLTFMLAHKNILVCWSLINTSLSTSVDRLTGLFYPDKGLVNKYRGGGGWAGAFRNVVVKKTHDPPLPNGAKRSDPPLNAG